MRIEKFQYCEGALPDDIGRISDDKVGVVYAVLLRFSTSSKAD
jgi:hypothetical protein